MTPFGIGTDILEISRIRTAISDQGDRFIQRIFTLQEQEYCKKCRDPLPRFAAYFSAKESIVKAFGCGIGKQIGWLDIIISHDALGKPVVILSDQVKQHFEYTEVLLSVSHCQEYVSTVALVLR